MVLLSVCKKKREEHGGEGGNGRISRKGWEGWKVEQERETVVSPV